MGLGDLVPLNFLISSSIGNMYYIQFFFKSHDNRGDVDRKSQKECLNCRAL